MNQELPEVSSTLAKRYAQAFLSVYGDQLSAQAVQQLLLFKQFLATNRALVYLFSIPTIEQETKERGLSFLAQKFELPSSLLNLMMLLLLSHRISLLPQVLCFIVALYKKEHGIHSFVIKSSHVLSEQDLDQLRDFLADQITGKQEADKNIIDKNKDIKIVYSYKQDKDLIAGIRMQSDTYLWEHSIARQLRAIELLLLR